MHMNTTATLQQMQQLKLHGMATSHQSQLELPLDHQLESHDLIALNEPTLADAIMDRLTARAHRIELKGDSMRKKKQ